MKGKGTPDMAHKGLSVKSCFLSAVRAAGRTLLLTFCFSNYYFIGLQSCFGRSNFAVWFGARCAPLSVNRLSQCRFMSQANVNKEVGAGYASSC